MGHTLSRITLAPDHLFCPGLHHCLRHRPHYEQYRPLGRAGRLGNPEPLAGGLALVFGGVLAVCLLCSGNGRCGWRLRGTKRGRGYGRLGNRRGARGHCDHFRNGRLRHIGRRLAGGGEKNGRCGQQNNNTSNCLLIMGYNPPAVAIGKILMPIQLYHPRSIK